jgi:DNA polymerase IV
MSRPDQAPAQRRIIHIDMDAFYASVEQRDDPSLRGVPLAVGGSRARGVVAAASYEARKFGVYSAMASVTARRKCPQLVFMPPRFDVYRAVSRQIHAIFARYTSLIQPLSLDEAYLDVTAGLTDGGSATAIAEEIRAAIRAETGLTASAGVSYNKLLAKLASGHRKPDGLFVITPRMGAAFVESLPVGKFHGIGPVTAARMNGLGIHTGLDLRHQSRNFLTQHFGKAGDFYYGVARGEDVRAGSGTLGRGGDRGRAAIRQGLVRLQPGQPCRTDRDGEDKIRRFPADHPKPVRDSADRLAGRAGADRP